MSRVKPLQHYCRVGCDYCSDLRALGDSRTAQDAIARIDVGYIACSYASQSSETAVRALLNNILTSTPARILLSARSSRPQWQRAISVIKDLDRASVSLVVSSQSENILGIIQALSAANLEFEILILVRRSVDPWALFNSIPENKRSKIFFWFPDARLSLRKQVDLYYLSDILAFLADLRSRTVSAQVQWRIENEDARKAALNFWEGQLLDLRSDQVGTIEAFWVRLLERRFKHNKNATFFNLFVDLVAAIAWLVFDSKWVRKKSAWLFAGATYRAYGFARCWGSRLKNHILYRIILRFYWGLYFLFGKIWEHLLCPLFWRLSDFFWRLYFLFGKTWEHLLCPLFWRLRDFLWFLFHLSGLIKMRLEAWGIRAYWFLYRTWRELPLLYWQFFERAYPLRKTYYFFRYQFRKRLFKTTESPYSGKSGHTCDPPAVARHELR